jgi:hypothetical protein
MNFYGYLNRYFEIFKKKKRKRKKNTKPNLSNPSRPVWPSGRPPPLLP